MNEAGQPEPLRRNQPEPGRIAHVRQRRYLVEGVMPPTNGSDATLVRLACVDDDAQGQPLEVLWEHELDAQVLNEETWSALGQRGFDQPDIFGAYYRTLRWNCVTATDPTLFQAPFRAGIRLDAYQLEPLRKALRLPRVNLFIADDVGLGKTIEAGLIARELLLRRRIDAIVVACPPSMLTQWQEELEARFGLTFVILDRDFVAAARRERGFGVNAWTTHSRFLVSHRLLIDEAYTAGLRDWLGGFRPRSLLILDEAHHAAPASSQRYAIDSQITRAIRDLAPRFEHRLFLSATPHNGHSNSFAALLEILDGQRFLRGQKVLKGQLDDVMVRRLKDDIRALEGGFPKRIVEQIDIGGLPAEAPELKLARLLDDYRTVRETRLKGESRSRQAAAALVLVHLQQRLLSSIEAFARTLKVHKRSLVRALEGTPPPAHGGQTVLGDLRTLTRPVDADDDRATMNEEDLAAEEQAQVEAATELSLGDLAVDATRIVLRRELAMVEAMEEIAETHRGRPDARVKWLLGWIEQNMCPGVRAGGVLTGAPPRWNRTRLLIFTEYEDTRRYVQNQLIEAIADTDQADARIAVFSGPTPADKRDAIKHAFNTEPDDDPLRILIATDAAREGINLQRHCRDMVHFDLPWNPSRLEQRNGRIDRKLQPAPEVVCRYFVYTQRPEDRVLATLVRKTEVIRRELGSLAQVLEGRLAGALEGGIRRRDIDALSRQIEDARLDDRRSVVEEELEAARERQDGLKVQVDRLRTHLQRAQKAIGIDPAGSQLRQALSVSLQLAGAPPLNAADGSANARIPLFKFPADDRRLAADPGWAGTLDTLRERRDRRESVGEWRRRAPIRAVSFEDPDVLGEKVVHIHLEHRVAQRLLGRFTSQGLVHFDLSRACLAVAPDAIPRVILLGRLALYGPGAARLHEEIVPVAARWLDPDRRQVGLRPYGRDAEGQTMALLETTLDADHRRAVPEAVMQRLKAAATRDIAELLPQLEARAGEHRADAEKQLAERATRESTAMRRLLEDQKARIEAALKQDDRQLEFAFDEVERRQRQADKNAWSRRLDAIDGELEHEPRRIAEGYTIKATRLEPVGLVYLWPVTG